MLLLAKVLLLLVLLPYDAEFEAGLPPKFDDILLNVSLSAQWRSRMRCTARVVASSSRMRGQLLQYWLSKIVVLVFFVGDLLSIRRSFSITS